MIACVHAESFKVLKACNLYFCSLKNDRSLMQLVVYSNASMVNKNGYVSLHIYYRKDLMIDVILQTFHLEIFLPYRMMPGTADFMWWV